MAAVTTPSRLSQLAVAALLCSLIGGAGLGFGFVSDPKRTLFSYLTAFVFVTSVSIGALFLLLIGYAANAKWMSVIRRFSEVVALGVVPSALLFIPVALGLPHLYVWANPPRNLPEHVQHLLEHKHAYLNGPSFIARSAVYFGIWIAAAVLLRAWSRRHTQHSPLEPSLALGRERAFSSVMLVPSALAVTFAAFDWLMSLDPLWFSSIFGIYYFAGGFLAGIAMVTLLAYRGRAGGATPAILTSHHFHALGRLLFAFTIFWAYAAYFQVFLISMTDRPDEVTFYIDRTRGSWNAMTYLLGLGHFLLPFLLLLPATVKHRPRYVATLASWILVMHLVDMYWVVMPAHSPGGASLHWLDLAALLTVGGFTTSVCAFMQRGVPLIAEADPFLPEGIHYASHS